MPDNYGLDFAESTRRDEPLEPSKPKNYCDYCGSGIYEGEQYFAIGGRDYCRQCVEDQFGRYA